MKIKEIKTYILSQELGGKSFCYSQAWYSSRTIMIVEIITDDGISGWGEAFGNAFVNQVLIDKVYAPKIVGKNIFDTSVIWDMLYNSMRDNGQKGCVVEAISAIDIALWDLKGKYTHMPVWRLLGGAYRNEIIPYATGLYRTQSDNIQKELIAEAEEYLNQGFKALKIKIGFGIKDDIQTVKNIRSVIGKDVALMVDANHAYNAKTAIYLAKNIEEYDITWLEEPVVPENIDGYVEVKQNTAIPVAGGEAEFTRYGFQHLLNKRGVDILQPDCCVTGGFSEFSIIAKMATLQQIQCYPHVWGSAIALNVGINCAFSVPHYPDSLNPHFVYLEYDRTPNIFREELSAQKPIIKNGVLHIQEKEGIGLEIDRDLIKKYSIK